MEENEKMDKLVALVLFETMPKFYDNPNGDIHILVRFV